MAARNDVGMEARLCLDMMITLTMDYSSGWWLDTGTWLDLIWFFQGSTGRADFPSGALKEKRGFFEEVWVSGLPI